MLFKKEQIILFIENLIESMEKDLYRLKINLRTLKCSNKELYTVEQMQKIIRK